MSSDGYQKEKLFGQLLDHAIVQLDPESLDYTTLWSGDMRGVARLHHDSRLLVKVFHGMCCEYERPFVIDVGAHIGTFSLEGALGGNVRGWAFEPHADAFNILQRNIALNSMGDRFTAFNRALTNNSGKCTLRIPTNKINSHLSCLGYPNYRQYFEHVVESVTLDEMIVRADVDSVDIMRIDTEGSELHVLLGAAETIRRYSPDLLIKYNWFKCAQSDIFGENVLKYLSVLGYQISWAGDEDLLCRHPERNIRRSAEKFAGWGTDIPKIALIKQMYDDHGPWQNERYDAANPLKVLDKWPAKYSYFEMTQLFKADWYVLPYCHDSRIIRQKIERYRSEIDASVQTVAINDIPFDEYDIVISIDPILRPSSSSKILFAYLQNEHHDTEYIKSLKKPFHGYDLFLDHMMEAPGWAYSLPQSLACPYVRDPATVRTLRSKVQDNSIWIDNRFVMMLSHGNETCHNPANEKILHNMGQEIGARFRFKHAAFDNIQKLQSPYAFLQELSQSRFYLNLIACGAGQGLCDAASLGLICFGTPKLKYHQAICHPACLCNDLMDFKRIFTRVVNSPDLQQEIIAWQDLMLADRMVRQPLHMLEAAVDLKRRKVLNSNTSRKSPMPCTITPLAVGEELPEAGLINYVKLRNLAIAENETNNYDAVLDYCKQSLCFFDKDIEIHFIMACAYYASGNKQKALEAIEKSKEINGAYKPVDQLLSLIGAEYINDAYAAFIDNYNSCVIKLRKYIDMTVINQIDDFDLANMDKYDEVAGALIGSLIKGERYDTHRLMIYHLSKQLKTVVAAELAPYKA